MLTIESIIARSTPETEAVNECHARLRETLHDCARLLADGPTRLPAGIEAKWHRHLDSGQFNLGSPRLDDLRPFVRAVMAVRVLNLAQTQREREVAAQLLLEAADEINRFEFQDDESLAVSDSIAPEAADGANVELSEEEAFRFVVTSAVAKHLGVTPQLADSIIDRLTEKCQ
jgi:hypothetical protein